MKRSTCLAKNRYLVWCAVLVLILLPSGGRAQSDFDQLFDEDLAVPADEESADEGGSDRTDLLLDSKPAADGEIRWQEGLVEGRRKALELNRPILVRFGAAWCPWCDKLAEELKKPELQGELSRWTLVYVDLDESPIEAGQLGVGPIPALRLLTTRGKLVASRDGYLSADDLSAWLNEKYDTAAAVADELLTSTDKPNADMAAKIVERFQEQDPVEREAAVRRLLPHPDVAASVVVEAFARGKLSTRLAALELLDQWQAPVKELDPWRPETLTNERQQALRQWAEASAFRADHSEELADDEREEARREMARLRTANDDEATAIRERLARFGPALLPLVYEELKTATEDLSRERLLALRYRLVASDALVLAWPGGLARLSATDVRTRHQAVGELINRASKSDERLLLELFSDADPLVRELSLRGLQQVGGARASGALIQLLDDPEPNVRAAVLKQIAERPSNDLIPKIAKYVENEKDPDLVVHAIRFFKAAGGKSALTSVSALLDHESWQVRAEAAETMGEIAGRNENLQATVYAELLELLDDEDAFVVSRAVRGLQNANLPSMIDPLANAALKHPELAADAVETMVSGAATNKAIKHLHEFAEHSHPELRAAAIAGYAKATPYEMEKPITAGLRDESSAVRQAAAVALWDRCRSELDTEINNSLGVDDSAGLAPSPAPPPAPSPTKSLIRLLFGKGSSSSEAAAEPVGEAPEEAADEDTAVPAEEASAETKAAATEAEPQEVDQAKPAEADNRTDDGPPRIERWLNDYRAGKGRPEWMASCVEPLEKMLASDVSQERLVAALALLPLGRDDLAVPVLRQLAETHRAQRGEIARMLLWLPWEKRVEQFEHLMAFDLTEDQFSQVARAMVTHKNVQACEPLWRQLARESVPLDLATAVYAAFETLFEIDVLGGYPAAQRQQSPQAMQQYIEDLKRFADQGTPWQRSIALALLLSQSTDDAVEPARKLLSETERDIEFRRDALQVLLLAQSQEQASQTAVEQISGENASLRKLALHYLTQGQEAVNQFRGHKFHMTGTTVFSTDGEPIEVSAPEGLTVELVRPLLADPDPEVAACAGYLLATLGESEGMDKLIAHWRANSKKYDRWEAPLYRAIAALDDARYMPILTEIYARLPSYEARDFYWTIRSMTGPEILKLRKRIRDEVGMDQLR